MPSQESREFSFRTRSVALERFRKEIFDFLIVGGGITGAAVARDAASRGLKVAVVEQNDFASGTSSKSSKLIHGGLRYLENMEFGLVFEALSERSFLLKTVPHMVKPLPFFMPVYKGDTHGRAILSLGLWLYDFLALFRTPGFHRHLSRKKLLKEIPFLKDQGLLGGFRYYDASMWDDVLAVQTFRSAHSLGAAIANYVEAVSPLWNGDRVVGFKVRDREALDSQEAEFELRAKRVIICGGPWTDMIGKKLSDHWRSWLNPSKGIHLVFDLKRIPVPGALVMSHPSDGRISFVIPRPDYGAGVVIVGTTDGPSPAIPEKLTIDPKDVQYLMDLLEQYFPDLKLNTSDILSAYAGIRPLVGPGAGLTGSEGQPASATSLQKVSREHHIGLGPGATVIVAGGKYTTHRTMGEQIVDFALKTWNEDAKNGKISKPPSIGHSNTRLAINDRITEEAIKCCIRGAKQKGVEIPQKLLDRYGAEAMDVLELSNVSADNPEGFPNLDAQLRHTIRTEMVMHLEDFYLRREPLYLSRKDHGLPWAERLSQIWAEERGLDANQAKREAESLKSEIERKANWPK